jgi:hypothetical protein
MAGVDFTLVQTTTGPALEEVLEGVDGEPLDLTGATVQFRMAPVDRSTAGAVLSATVLAPPTAGRVRITIGTAVAGSFDYQWIATLASAQVVAVPTDRYRRLVILPLLT